jgi:hypothetical protein
MMNNTVDIIKAALKDNPKIDVTADQLKQLELLVVAYMTHAALDLPDGDDIIKGLDTQWVTLFNVVELD